MFEVIGLLFAAWVVGVLVRVMLNLDRIASQLEHVRAELRALRGN